MPAIKTGKKTEKYTTEFKVKAVCSGATKPPADHRFSHGILNILLAPNAILEYGIWSK